MLDLIARYKHLIKSFHVLLYEQEGESFKHLLNLKGCRVNFRCGLC